MRSKEATKVYDCSSEARVVATYPPVDQCGWLASTSSIVAVRGSTVQIWNTAKGSQRELLLHGPPRTVLQGETWSYVFSDPCPGSYRSERANLFVASTLNRPGPIEEKQGNSGRRIFSMSKSAESSRHLVRRCKLILDRGCANADDER